MDSDTKEMSSNCDAYDSKEDETSTISDYDFHNYVTVIEGRSNSGKTNIIKNIIQNLPKQRTVVMSSCSFESEDYKECEHMPFSFKAIREILDKQAVKMAIFQGLNDVSYLHELCGKIIGENAASLIKRDYDDQVKTIKDYEKDALLSIKDPTITLKNMLCVLTRKKLKKLRKKHLKLLKDILGVSSNLTENLTEREKNMYEKRHMKPYMTLVLDDCAEDLRQYSRQYVNISEITELVCRGRYMGITTLVSSYSYEHIPRQFEECLHYKINTQPMLSMSLVFKKMFPKKEKRLKVLKKIHQIHRSSKFMATILKTNDGSPTVEGIYIPIIQ